MTCKTGTLEELEERETEKINEINIWIHSCEVTVASPFETQLSLTSEYVSFWLMRKMFGFIWNVPKEVNQKVKKKSS